MANFGVWSQVGTGARATPPLTQWYSFYCQNRLNILSFKHFLSVYLSRWEAQIGVFGGGILWPRTLSSFFQLAVMTISGDQPTPGPFCQYRIKTVTPEHEEKVGRPISGMPHVGKFHKTPLTGKNQKFESLFCLDFFVTTKKKKKITSY